MTGSGTQEDPYIISNVSDLQAVENDLTAYYELANDIDAIGTVGWNILVDRGAWAAATEYIVNDFVTNAGKDYYCKTAHTSGGSFNSIYWVRTTLSVSDHLGFDPIGTNWQTDPFAGQFDGKEYTISGLYINRPDIAFVGLFAATYPTAETPGGIVKNIKLTGVDITGDYLVGGLVGDAYSEIENCSTTGTVDGKAGGGGVGGLAGYAYSNISKCWSTCTITSTTTDYGIGGLIGYAALSEGKTIEESYATGNVTASDADEVGGLVGDSNADILNCYAMGAVIGNQYVGGFVGTNSRTIDKSYSSGPVVAMSGLPVGGFCGDNYGTITNCFWDVENSGQVASDGGTGKTTAQMKTKTTFTAVDWDFVDIWVIHSGTNYGYPCFGLDPIIYPSDENSPIRVSSIRRIYKPGLYRMEVAFGDLGFDVDVSEAAMRRVPDEVKEPEKPEEEAPEETTKELISKIIEEQERTKLLETMFPEPPLVSGKYTAPAPMPSLKPTPIMDKPIIELIGLDKIYGAMSAAFKWLFRI